MLKVSLLNTGVMSCIGVGWLANPKLWEIISPAILTGVTTVYAAYYGAKFAFNKNAEKEGRDIRNKNWVNGRMELFKLTRMFEILNAFQVQVINPYRNSKFPFLLIGQSPPRETMKLNLEALYFLFETAEPNLLGELAITEEWYGGVIMLINERSRMYREEYQPHLGELEKLLEREENQIIQIIGNHLFFTLKANTELMIKDVDETLIRIKKYALQLHLCLQEQFPERKPFNLIFSDEYKILNAR